MRITKTNQGITLIALVITIIVLLILAGVSISAVIGENGIATKAKEAKEATELAKEEEERVLMEMEQYINSEFLEPISTDTTITEFNRTLTGEKSTFKNPIIPVGFKAVNDGASWDIISKDEIAGWNNGLVIEDENENQFVWVPVDGTDVSYAKWCLAQWSLPYNEATGDDLPKGIDETRQISKYGGFWIARFETGRSDIDNVTIATNDVATGVDVLINKGAQPWTFITYTNAKKVAESYINNKNVKSGLVTGTQWDTTMKWIENAGYDVDEDCTDWGNYRSNANVKGNGKYSTSTSKSEQIWKTGSFDKSVNAFMYTGTGLYEEGKAKNIYGLAGNVVEWSAEQYDSAEWGENFVIRGGDAMFVASDPACFRTYNSEDYYSYGLGFRIVLYVM